MRLYDDDVELRRPTFDLFTIKLNFVKSVRMTATSRRCAQALDLGTSDVISIIATIERIHFVKSMTTHDDHKRWQDVYNVPHGDIVLYVKFSKDDDGHIVVSFKEK